jgi:hypothetical protein
MRTIAPVVLLVMLMIFAPSATAQVTNLTFNGSNSSFTFVSGNTLSWQYDIPAGDTAYCEIWQDINMNGAIDPGTDFLYLMFLQGDGVMDGLNGPPDIDGAANGVVNFSGRVGLAPGKFVIRMTNNGSGTQVLGTVTPLAAPAHTISGKITMPAGTSAQYFVLEASREGYELSFWHGIADANGDYVIQMDADTAGGPWHVNLLNNPHRSAVVTPDEYWVFPGANPSNINFTMQLPVAKIAGVVMDEQGNTLPEWEIFLQRNDQGIFRSQETDWSGTYEVGVLGPELNGQTWSIQAGEGGDMSTSTMMARRQLPPLQGGDSLYRPLVIYEINSQIQGQVRINGFAPGFPVKVVAWNADSAQNAVEADGATGAFSIGVTDRISQYSIFPIDLDPSYGTFQTTAHAGQTGVVVNLSTTSLEDQPPSAPTQFALEQNYPNPFNPSTVIGFSLPARAFVRLKVFNLLGQEVASLVNATLNAGRHTSTFDASKLPSGFYFYRLTAGSLTGTKAMVVVK